MNVLEDDRDVLTEEAAQGYLARHTRGDFGIVPEQDREFNLENIARQTHGGGSSSAANTRIRQEELFGS